MFVHCNLILFVIHLGYIYYLIETFHKVQGHGKLVYYTRHWSFMLFLKLWYSGKCDLSLKCKVEIPVTFIWKLWKWYLLWLTPSHRVIWHYNRRFSLWRTRIPPLSIMFFNKLNQKDDILYTKQHIFSKYTFTSLILIIISTLDNLRNSSQNPDYVHGIL